MVKKSKKSKSKRVTLRKKYKVLRKVKEHNKKKAKAAKKLGHQKAKPEKDPGIPNAWPFKEQELQALEVRRARALKELEEKKQAKKDRAKERAQKRKLGIEEDEEMGVEDGEMLSELLRKADSRADEYERRETKSAQTTSPQDGTKKAFYKELLKVIEASDVIIEVLDARDPLGTRCPDMERLVIKASTPKRLVLLLNKIDLVPREVAEKWLKYLREELPTVAFKCSTQKQKANLGFKKRKSKEILETSECLGGETLLQLLKNYSRNQQLKTSITVGVVGLPNAGKSSLINSLKRARAVSTGSTPGITRAMQEVQLDKHVKLLDCPGVVLATASDASSSVNLRNCVKLEKLEDVVSPVSEILRLCGREKLMSIYKITSFNTVEEFLQLVATIRGKFKKGGVADTDTAARIVLFEWNEGKIPHYTLPPVRQSALEHSESAIVSEWGKEFNVDDVFKQDTSLFAELPATYQSDAVELPSSSPMQLDSPADEDEQAAETNASRQQANAVKASSDHQTEKLYNAEGIFNPYLARAERKRKKKQKTAAENEANHADPMDEAYDFNVDYTDDSPKKSSPKATPSSAKKAKTKTKAKTMLKKKKSSKKKGGAAPMEGVE